MTWNYRVIKTTDRFGDSYAIHEVYYNDEQPVMATEFPITLSGDSIDEIKEIFPKVTEAFKKPVLIDSEQVWHKVEEEA
jgi:hypothetical protein